MLQKVDVVQQVPNSVQTGDDQNPKLALPAPQKNALWAKLWAFCSVISFCLILAISKAVDPDLIPE
jgi:hypothetical protein